MARHLLVTNDFVPKTGGIQVYLHELWRRLEPGRAVVLTASSHEDAAAFDASSDLVIERVERSTLFLPTPGARRAIESAIERHRPELVLFDPAWPLGLLGPGLSRPYGVVLHGAEVTIPAAIPFVATSLRRVLRHASVVVAAGSFPEAAARRNVGEFLGPVVRVPPGVDVTRFRVPSDDERRATRDELGVTDDTFLLTSHSRLVPRKGMDILIRASARVGARRPELAVQIGGEGRDRARLERLARRLKAPVTFLGRVGDDVLPRWLGASDLMVMDCRRRWFGLEQEGFGIVFAEAAACGVAQVAGRSGGSAEAVRHGVTGLVVHDPGDRDELAAVIEALMDDGDVRRRYARRARAHAASALSWDRLAQDLSVALAPFDSYGATSALA